MIRPRLEGGEGDQQARQLRGDEQATDHGEEQNRVGPGLAVRRIRGGRDAVGEMGSVVTAERQGQPEGSTAGQPGLERIHGLILLLQ
jgi:hypothetical protein